MAYSNPLDPSTPAGGAPANQLDDRIREVKAALIERLLTLVADVNAQPLVLNNNVIATANINDLAITQVKLALLSVGTAQLIDANVTTVKILDANVTTPKLADDAVTQVKMADNSVGTLELIDANVTTAKLLDHNVTQVKIAPLAVGTPELIDANVTTVKMADGSVTAPKLAAGLTAIAAKLVSGSLSLTQVQTTLADNTFKEFDVPCAGAVVGRPCVVQWQSSSYPTVGGSPGSGGWDPGDGIRITGWCITVNFIRVRIANVKTGGSLDMGATGAAILAYQIGWVDGH